MISHLKVIIADDHPIVRKGMIQIIADQGDILVVAEAKNGNEVLTHLVKDSVDVVVSDLNMPGMSGLELASHLQALTPPVPIILLTMHDDEALFNEAIDIGVSGYLLKDEAIDNITEAITSVAHGGSYVSPSLSKYVMCRSRRTHQFQTEYRALATLTPTERIVLQLVARNLSSKEIASKMGVSYHTITTHRRNLGQKLELAGKHPLLNFALANKSAILNQSE